ncbi:MAG: peptidoglycan -binding protein [Rhodospirillales bacterium]|nr:peptidoglycan -binding protein [Rhodospirillales bacterium]
MPVARRRSEHSLNIWPGFVDALATLLMVLIFLLLVFMLAQFFLNEVISGRDQALQRLDRRISELTDLLALERKTNESMRDDLTRLSQEFQASVIARDDMQTTLETATRRAQRAEESMSSLSATLEAERTKTIEQLREISRLAGEIERLAALRDELRAEVASLGGKLKTSESKVIEERNLSESARAEVALLNRQLAQLREQLARLNEILEASEKLSKDQKVEIAQLGSRLNAALASKVQELSRYRSEFFGRLREILGNHPGIRIVGDRFVFQSELLFETGSADIGEQGKVQLDRLAATLIDISSRIPPDIDWIMQIEGHTDRVPIKTARFPSNWELSTGRALSVVQYLSSRGLPANRLAAAGYGEFHPLDDRNDEIALRRNRRIELKLTSR